MDALLSAREVSKIYQMGSNNVTALDNVSIDVRQDSLSGVNTTSNRHEIPVVEVARERERSNSL